MKVTVKLLASLRLGRFDTAEFVLGDGGLVADAVAAAGLHEGEAVVILLNSRRADPGDRLAEGDLVAILPLVYGG